MDEVQLDQSANGTEARVHCGNTATGSDATSGGLPSLVPTDVGYSTTTSGTSPSFSVQSANHSAERSSISDGTVVGATLGGVAVLIGILGLVVRLLVKKPQSHITPMQMKYDLEMHDAVPHAGCHARKPYLISSGTWLGLTAVVYVQPSRFFHRAHIHWLGPRACLPGAV